MPRQLDNKVVEKLKQTLWDGASHAAAAKELAISRSYVSWIAEGKAYSEVPWPDGSTGGMPEWKKKESKPRRSQAAVTPFESNPLDTAYEARLAASLSQPAQIPLREAISLETLNKMEEIVSRQLEEELLAGVTVLDPEVDRSLPPPPRIRPRDRYDWEELIQMVPTNKYVVIALNSKDKLTQDAVCFAFKGLPQSQWEADYVWTNLLMIREELEKE